MTHAAPLLADIETLLMVVVFVIVSLSSVISQILAKKREQQEKAGRRERPLPPADGPVIGDPMAGRPAAGAPLPGGQPQKPRIESLGDEIAEFLRRAAENAQGRPREGAAPGRPAQAGLPPRPVQSQRPRPQQARPAPPQPPIPRRAQQPLQAEIVEPARRPLGQELPQQAARDISSSDIARRGRELGEETRQASAKLEQEIKKTFAHQLGSIAPKAGATTAPSAQTKPAETAELTFSRTSAAGFAALLSDAESLKQAIVINEILQRPVHRW